MPTIEYPTTLPGPMPGSFEPRPRRAASSIDGPLQQRARQRDAAGMTSQYTFVYTPAQMAVWRDWWRDDLLDGKRWFSMSLPGSGGLVPRVVRYRGVQQQLLGAGLYRVSASIEQRGAALVPAVTWDFSGSGTTSAIGTTFGGLDPSATYRLSLPAGQLYTAFSGWPDDSGNGGLAWSNNFCLTVAGYTEGPGGLHTQVFGSNTYHATAEAARAAFPSGYTVTGHASYTAWVYDNNPGDNRGGISLLLERV